MKDDIDEGAVNAQFTVILNQAKLFELVHKDTDPRAGGANHFRQRLLADLWDDDQLSVWALSRSGRAG